MPNNTHGLIISTFKYESKLVYIIFDWSYPMIKTKKYRRYRRPKGQPSPILFPSLELDVGIVINELAGRSPVCSLQFAVRDSQFEFGQPQDK